MACCPACEEGRPCTAPAAPGWLARPVPFGVELVSALAAETGYIAGAGPDALQAARTRTQAATSFLGDLVGESLHTPGARVAKADFPPLHGFRERVNIVTGTQLHESAANDALPALPGRYPTAGWDGETSAASPVVDRGGM